MPSELKEAIRAFIQYYGVVPQVVESWIGISYPISNHRGPLKLSEEEDIPMENGYHNKQKVTMADLGLSLREVSYQPLELFAREGARLLLRIAMEEEGAEFLGCLPCERSQDSIKSYRNGHRERRARCTGGEVEVMVPRVSDTAERFRLRILGAWQRRSQILDEVLPLLYLEGLSTRDFRRALRPLWGKSGLSKPSVSRANYIFDLTPQKLGQS